MLIVILTLTVLVLYASYLFLSNAEYRRKLSKIKSEPALPILGHALKLGSTNEEFLPALERMWTNTGRDKFRLRLGTTEVIIITKAEDVEAIISGNKNIDKNFMYKLIASVIGINLVTVKAKKWHPLRKLLNPAYNFKVLESYVDIFQSEVSNLMMDLTAKPQEDVDLYRIFYQRTLVTICRAGIGYNITANDKFEQYLNSIDTIISLINERMFSSWKRIDFLYNFTSNSKVLKAKRDLIYEINTDVINAKKMELKQLNDNVSFGKESLQTVSDDAANTERKLSFMELVLLARNENGEPLTDQEIIDEVTLFIMAGHETTASSAAFTSYNLATHPDIQEKAFKEQLKITAGDLNRQITYKDLLDMKYLERVIYESMRIFPPVPFIGREISENTVLPDGTELPLGCDVLLMPYLSHRNPEVFADPAKFDPDRFLNNVPIYEYYPFSAGPRNCIGRKIAMLEVKFYVASILRKIVLLPPKGAAPIPTLKLALTSFNGINVQWVPRD